ncbi:MAG: alkaline phosphatase family protein [Chloroflexi bacterium]|nr:alkaline phosphatase family protein [Chloroflexota bacterium]MCI0575010.1 alkaline phosphatase family protein [Chloroflexota bacterium]MCI0727689.1 alkaline phosphatase family protein [Chloroflexota bacterium]
MMKKTLLVGLDAACWAYLEPLLAAGRLPNLQQLLDAGAWGTLQSTLPAATPVAWASIITGKNPGKHGIFDMMWRRPGSYELAMTHAGVRRGTPFWRRLNEGGVRVGLVNVPFSHPPTPLDGFVLCGFGAAGATTDLAYPDEVLGWIEGRFGRYEPVVNPRLFRNGDPAELLAAEITHQAHLVTLAIELAEQYQVQTLVINLMLPDHANHKMPNMAQMEQALCHSDADVGRLLEGFRPDNVMLISDHGSRRLKGDFVLSAWLRDQGYATWQKRAPAGRASTLNWMLLQWLQVHQGWSGLPEKVIRRLLCEVVPRLPARAAERFWRRLEKGVPLAYDHVRFSSHLEYSRTRLFFGNRCSGVLYFNQAGREPRGVVPPDERHALAAELREQLARIEDPDSGRPLLSGVYAREQLYSGPAVAYAPDLVLDGYSSPWNICTPYRREAKAEKAFTRYFVESRANYGWHSRDGIFAFAGVDFATGRVANDRHVMDVPATLLHLYGIPVPKDYDGQVMSETLAEQRAVSFQPGDADDELFPNGAYSAEETEEIMEHLRVLGYVD